MAKQPREVWQLLRIDIQPIEQSRKKPMTSLLTYLNSVIITLFLIAGGWVKIRNYFRAKAQAKEQAKAKAREAAEKAKADEIEAAVQARMKAIQADSSPVKNAESTEDISQPVG
ncbi:DUF1378 family protein [Serratia ficaria]|uniref:DUF1378 family protein n=1 Tax=Serratia ficaria TaxID=61651 RepID=UPI0021C62506|nr:DUF1378 family protein [Serratia ficaria]